MPRNGESCSLTSAAPKKSGQQKAADTRRFNKFVLATMSAGRVADASYAQNLADKVVAYVQGMVRRGYRLASFDYHPDASAIRMDFEAEENCCLGRLIDEDWSRTDMLAYLHSAEGIIQKKRHPTDGLLDIMHDKAGDDRDAFAVAVCMLAHVCLRYAAGSVQPLLYDLFRGYDERLAVSVLEIDVKDTEDPHSRACHLLSSRLHEFNKGQVGYAAMWQRMPLPCGTGVLSRSCAAFVDALPGSQYMQEERAKIAIVLCMGTHGRLGASSPLSQLSRELLELLVAECMKDRIRSFKTLLLGA